MKYWFLFGLCVIPIAAIATEVDLSAKGLGEAKSAGGLLKSEGIKVDMAFTSYLKRVLALSEHAFSWIFGRFTDVSNYFDVLCGNVWLLWSNMTVIWLLYDCYMTAIWLLYDCYMRRLLRCLMDVRCHQNLRPGAGGSRSAARPSDEELAPQRANVWSPHRFGQEGDGKPSSVFSSWLS